MGHGSSERHIPVARLDAASAAAVAETLQALVAPSRLMILSRLRESPATVTDLAAAVGLEQSAVSHQLRLLRVMGMVTATRNGRSVTYALFDSHVASLLDEAVFHAEHLRMGRPESGDVRADDGAKASRMTGTAPKTRQYGTYPSRERGRVKRR